MNLHRVKCKCCGRGTFDCHGISDSRCCYSSSSTVTVTWSISGGTSSLASGSITAPWSDGGGSGHWFSSSVLPGYTVEVIHADSVSDDFFSASSGQWSIEFRKDDDTEVILFECEYSGGDWDSAADGRCCGITTTVNANHTFFPSGEIGPDDGKSTSVTTVVHNNRCCAIQVTEGLEFFPGSFTCVKLPAVRNCASDGSCNNRCAGCCATYRVTLGNFGTLNGTYDLTQETSDYDADSICRWAISVGSPNTGIVIGGNIMVISNGVTVFTYQSEAIWDGCSPTDFAYVSQTGTPDVNIPTVSVSREDCP